MATLGRTEEVQRFLTHLDTQSHRNFELIVVDQNSDDRLTAILEPYCRRFPIKHLRSEKGLSRARNVGLTHMTGELVAFPDDDGWYRPGLLEDVARIMTEHPEFDGLSGICTALMRPPATITGQYLNRTNVWRLALSITVFLRATVVSAIGYFDERLGAGADSGFGSGEETDYLIRAIQQRYRIRFDPIITVNHPATEGEPRDRESAYSYGRGFGHTLRKHSYPFWFVLYVLIRPVAGMIACFAFGNMPGVHYHCAVLRGRVSGWLG